MSITIYSSQQKEKVPFIPLEEGKVRMYVCGITAYDRCHIGHARSAVVFDVICRYLRKRGFKVIFVRNFTDIDDKIINRSKEEGISVKELSEREIANFYEDMERLGVKRADIEPRATAHIPEIISLIERLIKNGNAYCTSNGDVYFRVRSFPDYGNLSGRNIDELRAGARIEVGEAKEDPLDFALWKASKPGEPEWDSPWGKGRPGWHIECSAMSMKYLGKTIDIHGGGLDLIFPHHENEKAQSEAANNAPFVRYWMHNGFVTIKGEKMSKSLGNFVTIKDILSEFHPEALRLFLLSKHYRSPLDYSPELLRGNEVSLMRCYNALYEAKEALKRTTTKKKRPISDKAQEAYSLISAMSERFFQAMDDDFNTAKAIGLLFEAVRMLNILTEEAKKRQSALYCPVIEGSIEAIIEMGDVLGILKEDPQVLIEEKKITYLEKIGVSKEIIEEKIAARNEARANKDWETADKIRDELAQKGIVLMDTPDGTRWNVNITN